jgi:hypothetical protein
VNDLRRLRHGIMGLCAFQVFVIAFFTVGTLTVDPMALLVAGGAIAIFVYLWGQPDEYDSPY